MRCYFKSAFKKYFADHLMASRTSLNLTQTQTAKILQMSHRSYIELEHGSIGCSSLTLALFLLYLCDNPLVFLSNLRAVWGIAPPIPIVTDIADKNCAMSYRISLSVKEIKKDSNGKRHAICPRCGHPFNHTDMQYCEYCGQKLDWNRFPGPIVN